MILPRNFTISSYGLSEKEKTPIILPKYIESILQKNESSQIYVTEDIALAVCDHVAKNYNEGTRDIAPLILVITGIYGIGKTASVSEILKRLNIKIFLAKASDFESEWSGRPIEYLKSIYIKASEYQKKENHSSCLLVEDIDLGIGKFKDSYGTSNKQHMNSFLMELADRPHKVNNILTDRIPLIATCNDLSKIYGAVKRPRRMRAWHYNPSSKNILAVGRHILRDIVSDTQFQQMSPYIHKWTPAHYAHFVSLTHDYIIQKEFHDVTAECLIDAVFMKNISCMSINESLSHDIILKTIKQVDIDCAQTEISHI